jgi:hypothetical protein
LEHDIVINSLFLAMAVKNQKVLAGKVDGQGEKDEVNMKSKIQSGNPG